jgi:hypothetical protein
MRAQDLGRGRGLREGQLAVLLDAEIAPERDEEEDPQAAAEECREEDLDDVRGQAQDVKGRDGEDGSRDQGPGGGADRLKDDVLEDRALPLVDVADADGQDGHGDGRFGHRADLEAQVGDGKGEEQGHEQAPEDRPQGDLGEDGLGRHERLVDLTGAELLVGLGGQGCLGRLHLALLSNKNEFI